MNFEQWFLDSMERTGNSQEKGNFDRFLEWIVQGFGNGNGKVCLEHKILSKKTKQVRVKPAFLSHGNVRVCILQLWVQVLSFSASVVGTELSPWKWNVCVAHCLIV